MDTVFDIGFYNGADSAYYIELGFKVVAVEANPVLIERAQKKFQRELEGGSLTLLSGAISDSDEQISLIVSGDDMGSSSVIPAHVQQIQPIGSYTVQSIRFSTLLSTYGTPYFLKVDIEGSDRHCILALTANAAPQFLSFEIGADFEELFAYVRDLGYDRFKIIDQGNFRSLARSRLMSDRIRNRAMCILGFADPRMVRRKGRFFRSGSSGPVPWVSDGEWATPEEIYTLWATEIRSGQAKNWYDLQATRRT